MQFNWKPDRRELNLGAIRIQGSLHSMNKRLMESFAIDKSPLAAR